MVLAYRSKGRRHAAPERGAIGLQFVVTSFGEMQ
jgi:hypothetical protein